MIQIFFTFCQTLYSILAFLVSFLVPMKGFFPFSFLGGTKSKPTAAVVGAGFGGLTAAIKLQQKLGIRAEIFERANEIGGVWQANRYPGSGCDVMSHLYSFSFELNPDWTEACGSQPEILDYMRRVAQKYKIYDQLHLNTRVLSAHWLEDRKKWKLDYKNTEDGSAVKTAYFDILITALGSSRRVKIPNEYLTFKGPILHTAKWDDSIDLQDKRIAVIGNGSSSIQLIPELQKKASKIISYHRSPCWILNKAAFTYSPRMRQIFSWFPILMRLHRFLVFWMFELYYPMLIKNYKTSRRVKFSTWFFRKEMLKELEKHGRPDLAPILIPQEPIGCKRIGFSANYLEAMTKQNVTIKMGTIDRIQGRTIYHKDGSQDDVDVVVLATGFDAQSFLGKLKIVGRHGLNLNEKWTADYPSSYKSINVHGFPNLFMILGPNYCAQNNVISIIDVLTDSAIRAISHMMKNNVSALEVKKEAQNLDTTRIRNKLKDTAWAGNCTSYYKNEKEQITIMFPGSVTQFWYHLSHENYAKDFIHYFK